jgi:hypothetical protein
MSNKAHLVLALLTVVAIVVIVRLVRQRVLKAKYSLLWLSLGVGMAVIAAWPGGLDWVAERVGIFYPPALYLLLGIAFLLLLSMHFSYELSRMENRVRTLAEEVALLRHELDEGQEERAAP